MEHLKSGAETCIHGLGLCCRLLTGNQSVREMDRADWQRQGLSVAAGRPDKLSAEMSAAQHPSRDPDCIGSVPAPQGLNAEAAGRGGERIRPLELSWPRLSRHPSRDDAIRGGRGSGVGAGFDSRLLPDGDGAWCRSVAEAGENRSMPAASIRPAASDPNRIDETTCIHGFGLCCLITALMEIPPMRCGRELTGISALDGKRTAAQHPSREDQRAAGQIARAVLFACRKKEGAAVPLRIVQAPLLCLTGDALNIAFPLESFQTFRLSWKGAPSSVVPTVVRSSTSKRSVTKHGNPGRLRQLSSQVVARPRACRHTAQQQ